ncbi:MAG TPA: hypothetical protein VMT95_02205 [Candidatus Binatia bacterium]|nr:hypothetical protein [Candidatus Binatia bacterium]
MQTIKETQRHPSPGGRPQPLAFHDGLLWIGSWDTGKLYGMDARQWAVKHEVDAPGRPFGLASLDGALRVVVALDDDDRYLFSFTPERGFDASSKTPCPDFTGSHLASDGASLYLCQQGKHRILELDDRGGIRREIALPTRCGGFAFRAPGDCRMLSADEDFDHLTFARIDVNVGAPPAEPIAPINAEARALTFDGELWWTSYREENEVVAFTAG